MMERLQTITHQGKLIVRIDFSNFSIQTKDELNAVIDQAEDYIAQQPPDSVLVLTVVTKLHFDTEIMSILKEYTAHNKPYVKASAIVGIAGLLNIALNSVVRSALRDIQSFDTEELALDWLVEQ